jgi:hypothetical protein
MPLLANGVSTVRDSRDNLSAADKQNIFTCILHESWGLETPNSAPLTGKRASNPHGSTLTSSVVNSTYAASLELCLRPVTLYCTRLRPNVPTLPERRYGLMDMSGQCFWSAAYTQYIQRESLTDRTPTNSRQACIFLVSCASIVCVSHWGRRPLR